MIKFNSKFIALSYPGYFWNTEDEKLYSIKIEGILTPLAEQEISYYQSRYVFYDVDVG